MRRLKYSSWVICLVWASSQSCGDDTQVPVSVIPIADGAACSASSQCESGHCQNNFCCASGDCCSQASDCPASYAVAAGCDTAATCQGTRQDAECSAHICGTGAAIDDDTGCTNTTQAKDCTPYAPVSCTGDPAQSEPMCGPDCSADDDCATDYHCDTTCQADLADGLSCDEDSDCTSGHCQNDFCCTSGDCCSVPGDCPSDYSVAASCDDAVTCQGTRTDATCVANVCATGSSTEDDTPTTRVARRRRKPRTAHPTRRSTAPARPSRPSRSVQPVAHKSSSVRSMAVAATPARPTPTISSSCTTATRHPLM